MLQKDMFCLTPVSSRFRCCWCTPTYRISCSARSMKNRRVVAHYISAGAFVPIPFQSANDLEAAGKKLIPLSERVCISVVAQKPQYESTCAFMCPRCQTSKSSILAKCADLWFAVVACHAVFFTFFPCCAVHCLFNFGVLNIAGLRAVLCNIRHPETRRTYGDG